MFYFQVIVFECLVRQNGKNNFSKVWADILLCSFSLGKSSLLNSLSKLIHYVVLYFNLFVWGLGGGKVGKCLDIFE